MKMSKQSYLYSSGRILLHVDPEEQSSIVQKSCSTYIICYIMLCYVMLRYVTLCIVKMSRVMRKPVLRENKDADQLRSNCKTDQRLCFRYTDNTIPLLSKFKIFSL